MTLHESLSGAYALSELLIETALTLVVTFKNFPFAKKILIFNLMSEQTQKEMFENQCCQTDTFQKPFSGLQEILFLDYVWS
jgi:hypothetical protein